MTLEQAYNLLKPDVTAEDVLNTKKCLKMMELFNLKEINVETEKVKRALEIVEACEVACECIKRCMESEDDLK